MEYKHFCMVFLVLVFSTVLTANGNASANLYLYPPSPAYFSDLGIGENFTVEMTAKADPGVTLFAFTVTWTPQDSVEFVRPVSEGSPELAMTGFFPPSDSSRLSGIVPNWRTQEATGSPGATPEIAVFTAPAENHTGPDSLAEVTFRKLSESQPVFSLTNAVAEQYLGGIESQSVSVAAETVYTSVDFGSAQIFGAVPSQATAIVVTIGGNDYQADVAGNTWALDIKTVTPSLAAQPVTVKAMQDGNLLSSAAVMAIIRSPGWFQNAENHGEQIADSDGDGSKDLFDLVRLGRSYGASAGHNRYDFRADYNADGVVNLADLLIYTYYGR